MRGMVPSALSDGQLCEAVPDQFLGGGGEHLAPVGGAAEAGVPLIGGARQRVELDAPGD
ncbi:hypothetical protein [Streptomyces sp. N2A]|uniref:hypothetical protein n=1 Tax=Streptomyces sp. N2A TaxID=3073936 RepID=UPI002870B389|nr:hypothetical protein [Streptomyces sp. N2A]